MEQYETICQKSLLCRSYICERTTNERAENEAFAYNLKIAVELRLSRMESEVQLLF